MNRGNALTPSTLLLRVSFPCALVGFMPARAYWAPLILIKEVAS